MKIFVDADACPVVRMQFINQENGTQMKILTRC